MKILMYADGFGVKTQTFITQDVRHLSKNHEVVFVCTHLYSDVSIENVVIKQVQFKRNIVQRKLWDYDLYLNNKNKFFEAQINKLINEFKPDLIHCQFGIEALKFIDNIGNNSIPLVIQFRGYDASSMLMKKSYVKRLRVVLDRDNYYSIFVSNSLRDNLKKHNINVQRSMVLYSGIDISRFVREKEKKKSVFIFLQVSSLDERKGHEYTLEAFAKFISSQKSKNYKLIFTGDGVRKSTLLALANNLNIRGFVDFVGFVTHGEAKKLMQNADVFVHHSVTPRSKDQEGIPNAIMEAMTMELPIISTYHSGIPELVTDGVNGYLVEEKDIDTYAQRMNDIIHWGKLKRNRGVIEKKFEIERHIARLESFYAKMAKDFTPKYND